MTPLRSLWRSGTIGPSEVLIAVGAVLLACVIGDIVFERAVYGAIPEADVFVYMVIVPLALGLLTAGWMRIYRHPK